MRWTALRPVGELVDPLPAAGHFAWPEGYNVAWLDSGTTALAVALKATIGPSTAERPRVLAPAYTCPDVLSAIAWAGAMPILADTQPGTPWIDAAAITSWSGPRVEAVVAPHFLGIAHPREAVFEASRAAGVVLVEDSAQLGPGSSAFRPVAELVILSFGRGKPVPAGGGALLYRTSMAEAVKEVLETLPLRTAGPAGWRARIRIQNAAMTRLGFGLVRRLPALAVGETRYKPLQNPARLPLAWAERVEATLASWEGSSMETSQYLMAAATRAGFDPVAAALGWDGRAPLLRLPVLARDRGERDTVVAALDDAGLGATTFYRDTLPHAQGVPACEQVSELDNATEFAARLFTLPCHSGVSPRDREAIANVMERAA